MTAFKGDWGLPIAIGFVIFVLVAISFALNDPPPQQPTCSAGEIPFQVGRKWYCVLGREP